MQPSLQIDKLLQIQIKNINREMCWFKAYKIF
jgi:hypothetical protein